MGYGDSKDYKRTLEEFVKLYLSCCVGYTDVFKYQICTNKIVQFNVYRFYLNTRATKKSF